MRYHLESTLPIHAFNPLGGRHSPFKHGMTLEGGGGGGIISGIGDAISGVVEGVGDALAGVDKAVGDTVPGGWGTIAAIAVPYAAPMITGAALTAGQAAALAAGTSAATGAIRGDDPEDILKNAALAGATSYGLGSLGGESIDLPSETPYIDMPDGAELLTPESLYVPDEAAGPYIDGTTPPPRDFDYIPESSGSPELTPKGTLSPEEQFAKDNYVPSELRAPDYVEPTYIPSELNLGNLYQDMPDGATELGYTQEVLASSTPTPLSQEEQYEKFYKELLNNPQSTNTPEGVQIFDRSTPASAETQKMVEKGYLDRMTELPGAAYDAAKSYIVNNPYTSAAVGLGALSLANSGQQPQPQGSPVAADSRYTGGYGSAGIKGNPYILRNRVNASNVYQYRNPNNPYVSRYKEGGEVKHFGVGGISNALTKTFQPIEKAVLQPIGQAAPFLKDVAPYAGLVAAPFIASPFAAAGVGALSSGFGRPGTGFDMKRALMGGIAAYGASTAGAGFEAAGAEPTKPLVDTLAESYAVPGTEVPASTAAPKGFFRDTDAMQRGVGNLLGSDSKAAAAKFGTEAGTFKSGVPLVMGTSGMMAIDEANKMREEAERSAGAGKQEQAEMLARISAGRKRAEQAVRENPYMYAMGGTVNPSDDQTGITTYSPIEKYGLGNITGYAAGGMPRFLSGGGDGMSDSIKANIEGTQEARLADGEFVIPADVVSHLGNGSSKAGAKQLYSMMDRVRKARTGNEKQGRQIKPQKLMPV